MSNPAGSPIPGTVQDPRYACCSRSGAFWHQLDAARGTGHTDHADHAAGPAGPWPEDFSHDPVEPIPDADSAAAPRVQKRITRHTAAALFAGLVLIGSGAAGVAVRIYSMTDPSPATGSARVIAQGIAPLIGEQVVWRAVRYQAQPRSTALAAVSPLSFLIASDEPLLLSNDDPATVEEDLIAEARLAPGEAMMVRSGTQQQRASVTDASTEYIAMELVEVAQADNVVDGQVLFISNPFVSGGTTPDLEFDLDLVSAVLSDSDSTVIPDTGQSVAILATDGAIDVIPSGGRRRTLQVGEGDVFTGEIEIQPAEGGSRWQCQAVDRLAVRPQRRRHVRGRRRRSGDSARGATAAARGRGDPADRDAGHHPAD